MDFLFGNATITWLMDEQPIFGRISHIRSNANIVRGKRKGEANDGSSIVPQVDHVADVGGAVS